MMKKLLQIIIISGLLINTIPTSLISTDYPVVIQELGINKTETKTPKKTTLARIKKAFIKFSQKRSTKITAATIITITSVASLAAYVYAHPEEASAAITKYTFHTSDAEIASIHASIL